MLFSVLVKDDAKDKAVAETEANVAELKQATQDLLDVTEGVEERSK